MKVWLVSTNNNALNFLFDINWLFNFLETVTIKFLSQEYEDSTEYPEENDDANKSDQENIEKMTKIAQEFMESREVDQNDKKSTVNVHQKKILVTKIFIIINKRLIM